MNGKSLTDLIWRQVQDLGADKRPIVERLVSYSLEDNGIAICSFRMLQSDTGKSLSTIHGVVLRLRQEGLVEMRGPGILKVTQSGGPEFPKYKTALNGSNTSSKG